MAKEKPLPKTLGACADELGEIRVQLSAAKKLVEALKARRTALTEKLIAELPVSDSDGIVGRQFRATVVAKDIPVIEDWAKLTAHVKKTGDFSLLQRRLSSEAIKERWEEKQAVPGVGVFHDKQISLTKK